MRSLRIKFENKNKLRTDGLYDAQARGFASHDDRTRTRVINTYIHDSSIN